MDFLNVLVIGPWGTGKTTFAATFPDPIYIFDMNFGLQAINDTQKAIEYDTYTDENLQRPTAATAIEGKLNEFLKECPYKTVVFDTTTDLADLMMNRILATNGRPGGPAQLQDYLKLTDNFKQFIYKARALKCHVLFIAHEHIDRDENTGQMESKPLLSNKLASRLGSMFNEVYYTSVVSKREGPEFKLLTGVQGIRKGKTHLGKGGRFDLMEKPDFEHLMSKVKGG